MDKVGICNMAIGNLGISKFIGNLDTENSNEARVCRVFYDQALNKTLEEMPWSFTRAYADLQDIGTPPSKWLYRYRYPLNCLFVRAVTPRDYFPQVDDYFNPYLLEYINRKQFEIVEDQANNALAICTNIPEAQACFTMRIVRVQIFPALFCDALAWCLASYIASPLSAQPSMAQLAGQAYTAAILKAAGRDLNQGREEPEKESEFISARS